MINKILIPIHSVIDLITNSSTELFVHSENSIEPVKELLNELLRIEGSDKTCDEVFDISMEYDIKPLNEFIENYFEDNDEILQLEYKDRIEFLRDIINKRKPEPNWWDDIVNDCGNNYHVKTLLVVKPKEEKYNNFSELLRKFLYSPHYYEHSFD